MDFSSISKDGWRVILVFGILIFILCLFLVLGLFLFFSRKNLKTKIFETEDIPKETQRELYIAEGKDQLENQCQVAKQILKELRVRIFEEGKDIFNLKEKDLQIWELITYRIIDRINYDVRNDLTRNHISKKTDLDLQEYSRAKSRGYFSLIKDRLYTNNSRLPSVYLPSVMDGVSALEVENFFKDVYFSARRICGITKK